jgi:hypothetical protein
MNGGGVPRSGRSIRGDEDHLSGIGPEYEPRHLGCYEFFGFLRQFADLAPYPDAHRHRLFSKSGRGQPHSMTLPRNRMPFRVPTGFGVRLSSAAFPLELSTNLRIFIKFPDGLSPAFLILTRIGSAGASPHRAVWSLPAIAGESEPLTQHSEIPRSSTNSARTVPVAPMNRRRP